MKPMNMHARNEFASPVCVCPSIVKDPKILTPRGSFSSKGRKAKKRSSKASSHHQCSFTSLTVHSKGLNRMQVTNMSLIALLTTAPRAAGAFSNRAAPFVARVSKSVRALRHRLSLAPVLVCSDVYSDSCCVRNSTHSVYTGIHHITNRSPRQPVSCHRVMPVPCRTTMTRCHSMPLARI